MLPGRVWAALRRLYRRWRKRRVRKWLEAEQARRARAANRERSGPAIVAAILPVLGASAGLVALATLAGGAMLWIRFDDLGLPADRAVALVPKELLVVIGAQALVVPSLIGIAALLVLVLFAPFDAAGRTNWRFAAWMILAGAAALIAILYYSLAEDLDGTKIGALLIAAFVGLGAIGVTARRVDLLRYVTVTVFAVCAVFGAGLAIARTKANPKMEPVAVLLEVKGTTPATTRTAGRDGKPAEPAKPAPRVRGMAGFYVGETADRLFIVPLPSDGDPGDPFADWPVDRVIAIERSEVTRLAIRAPTGTSANAGGRYQAHTMLAELRQSAGLEPPSTRKVVTAEPAVAFAPLVHLHHDDSLRPMSANEFIARSRLMWRSPKDCDERIVAVGRKLDDETGAGRIALGKLGDPPLIDVGVQPYAENAQDEDCKPLPQRFTTVERSRPFDGGRPTRRIRAAARYTLDPEQGFYLDLDDDARPGREDPPDTGNARFFPNVPVYYELRDAQLDGKRGTGGWRYQRLIYWFLYGHSAPPPHRVYKLTSLVSHEGDWERISVLVLARPRAGVYRPVSVRYHYHDDYRDVPWQAVQRTRGDTPGADQETHPIVYSASHSHASYPVAGRVPTPYKPGRLVYFVVHDDATACPDCPQWRTWNAVVDAHTQPWYGFGGAWGAVRNRDFRGPLGPSGYKLGPDERAPARLRNSQRGPIVQRG